MDAAEVGQYDLKNLIFLTKFGFQILEMSEIVPTYAVSNLLIQNVFWVHTQFILSQLKDVSSLSEYKLVLWVIKNFLVIH